MHVLHGSKSKKIKIKMHTTQNALAYEPILAWKHFSPMHFFFIFCI